MKNRHYSIINICIFICCAMSAFSQTANKKIIPLFSIGEAQIVLGFSDPQEWIKEQLWVETTFDSDGDGKLDRMHVFLTRPKQTETDGLRLPVIYETSPYFSGVGGNSKDYFWKVNHEIGAVPPPHKHPDVVQKINRPMDEKWVKRGFVTVFSSSPGTGLSDGSPTIGGENETLAPKAVIDWLCGRADGFATRKGTEKIKAFWCTGKVGMTGTSYNGTLCVAAAVTGVEGLEVIIPVAPVTSWYKYYRSNGLVRSPGGYLGEDMDVLYDFVHSGDVANRKRNDLEVRDKILVPGEDRITGDFNDFWASRDYLPLMKNMKAALLMSHGFNDWNVMAEHSYRIYAEAQKMGLPSQIFYHQDGHGGPPPFSMMNKWFTHFLHGVENDILKTDKAWIVREDDKLPTCYVNFPNPEAKDVEFHLQANTKTYGNLVIKPIDNQAQQTFVDNAKYSATDLAKANNSNNRLLFLTPVLKKDVHISGTATIQLKISSDQPAVNLSVYLIQYSSENVKKINMKDHIINRAWTDPQNHESLRKGTPLVKDQFYDLTIDFMPDDQIIPAGERIGLMIFSSDKEFTLQPKKGTKITLDLDNSVLTLPVVSGF